MVKFMSCAVMNVVSVGHYNVFEGSGESMQAEEQEGFATVQNYQMLVNGVWKPLPKRHRYLASVCEN